MTTQNGNSAAGVFSGALNQGLEFLANWGKTKIEKEDAKTQQALIAADAEATGKKTMFFIIGAVVAVVLGVVLWRMIKKA